MKFYMDELLILAMYHADTDTKDETINKLKEMALYIDNPDMTILVQQTIEKLKKLDNKEYRALDLGAYQTFLEEDYNYE